MGRNDLPPCVALFGKRVREVRREKGFTQGNLADLAGLHYTYISLLERGERGPGLHTILRVADALGVHPSELLPEGAPDHPAPTPRITTP